MTGKDILYLITHPLSYSPLQPLRGNSNLPPDVTGENIAINPFASVSPVPITEQQKRQMLYESMTIKQQIITLKGTVLVSNVPAQVKAKTDRMILNKQRYRNVARMFANPIRWYHIACFHEMEGEQNFSTYLGNGQTIFKKTTIVPKGRGPFASFEQGAVDSIRLEGLDKVNDWSIGNFLYIAEGFNGFGYSKFKHINSPYIWSGSSQYTSGKYISDGVYSTSEVSQQIGIALLLKSLDLQGQFIN